MIAIKDQGCTTPAHRLDRICNIAAGMLKPDSPATFIEAAIEVAFLIDRKVTERLDKDE